MSKDSKSPLFDFNGEHVPEKQASVSVLNHALHDGTSVFEGIRAYKPHQCTAIFCDHRQRLIDSAKIYRLVQPYSKAEIKAESRPIQTIDGQKIDKGRCAAITQQLQQTVFGRFNGETDDHEGWLDDID